MSRRVMVPPDGSPARAELLLKPTELQPQRGKPDQVYRAFTEETDGALRSAIAGVHSAHDERELRTSVNLGLLSILHALLALDERLWRLENELCRMQIP